MRETSNHVSKHAVLEAVGRQRARTLELASLLSAEEWDTIALPGWRVREVLGHLVASDEGAVKLRMLRIGLRPQADGAIDAIEQWNETQVRRWSERSVADLLAGLRTWGNRSVAIFKPFPSVLLSKPIPLPFGKVPLLFLGQLRVLDEWVHEQDIRRALNRPGYERETLRSAARAMLDVARTQTPARIPAGSNGRVALVIEAQELPALNVDLAARTIEVGAHGFTADASISADPATIIMVAAQRDSWREALRSGAITIDGDVRAAETLLDALRAG